MSRITPVDADGEPEELREVFDELRRTRGRVPGMYRTLAHRPEIVAAHRAYFRAALDEGVLPRAFKEQVAFKVALESGSAYSAASHRRYAVRHGVAERALDRIARSDYSGLGAAERAALQFADEAVRTNGAVSDEAFASLTGLFPAAEVVEIAALVGIMQLASSLGAMFGLAPDPGQEPGETAR
jgi:AhpD family alkylhydroperoxidase